MRGRPSNSPIRENILEILAMVDRAYGYEIYQHYRELFPKASRRSIYYQLKKAANEERVEVVNIETQKGDYSWGDKSERVYYRLKDADVRVSKKVKEYFTQASS